MTPSPRTGSLLIALAAGCWGTWRLWLHGPALDAAAQGALALTVSGVVALVVAFVRGGARGGAGQRPWGLLGAFAASEAANYALYFGALDSGDVATAAVTHYLAPVLVALVSPLLGIRVSRRTAWSIPVAFVATVVLAQAGGEGEATRTAALWGSASAIFYAANIFLGKRLGAHFTPWELIAYHNLLAAPAVWALSSTPPWTASAPELGLAVFGSFFVGVFAASTYFVGLSVVTPARAGVLAYVEPVVAALVGIVVFAEPVTGVRAAAMLVVLGVGVVVVSDPGAVQKSPELQANPDDRSR